MFLSNTIIQYPLEIFWRGHIWELQKLYYTSILSQVKTSNRKGAEQPGEVIWTDTESRTLLTEISNKLETVNRRARWVVEKLRHRAKDNTDSRTPAHDNTDSRQLMPRRATSLLPTVTQLIDSLQTWGLPIKLYLLLLNFA